MEAKRQMNDFIEIYDNGLSQELCNELIKWFDLCSEKNFTLHNTPFGNKPPPPTTIRSDESVSIPNDSVSSLSLPNGVCQAVFQDLNNSLAHYATKYDMGNKPLSNLCFKMHKVNPGQGYHIWHCENSEDGSITRSRILAWMTYLKVPEEGGETEFLYQSKRIEPIVGRTLIWPAYFTHMHRGNPPLKGEKYYITGWFEKL